MTDQTNGPLSQREAALEAELARMQDLLVTAQSRDYRHRAIFESAVDFAIIATDRDGRVTDWNSGAELILGWSAPEMLGKLVDRIFTPEDRAGERPDIEMRCALETGRGNDERWHLRKDASRFWANGEMMPLRDDDGNHLGYLKILRDRTSQQIDIEAQQSEAAFVKSVLASSADCIKVLDLDGNLTWMSDNGQRLMEVGDFNAIRGCAWPDFWHGQGNHEAKSAVNAARRGSYGRFQAPANTFAGTPRWWDVQVTPILGKNGQPAQLLSVSRDITEIKNQEIRRAALVRLGDELRSLKDWDLIAASAGRIAGETLELAQASYATVSDDGTKIAIRAPWQRDHKVAAWDGPRHLSDYGRYADDLMRGTVVSIADTRRSPVTADGASILLHPGMTACVFIPLLENGYVAGVFFASDNKPRIWSEEEIAFLRNVADRTWAAFEQVKAEQALRALNETLVQQVEQRTRERNRIWETTNDLMATTGLDGYLRAVNPAWTRLLGWTDGELMTRPFHDFIDPADHPETDRTFKRLAAGERVSGLIDHLIRADGTQRTVMWDAVPEGDVVHVIGRDITELRQTEEQLRQSQKMEAVGQLTGGLAHDFNNLLTGVTGSLELMQARVKQGRFSDLKRFIDLGQSAAQRAAVLTARLLAFSRRQTLDPKPTDINRLVAGLEELLRRTIGPSVQLDVIGADDLWNSLVDASQLENALLNLCINARDAMPDGGSLTIETSNRRLDTDKIDVPGEYILVCVTDTGAGMPPSVIERAFDPFFTTKPIGEGTGLGLSMVYGFMRQSGGRVSVSSHVGQGTAISLYLPRHDGVEHQATAPMHVATTSEAATGETVLIIDDEPAVRSFVTEVLSDLGYRILEAVDGRSGLHMLQSEKSVDLLLVDIGLPGGLNGVQVADAGCALRPGLKVLFMTGYAEAAITRDGQPRIDTPILTKPFAMDTLTHSVQALLAA